MKKNNKLVLLGAALTMTAGLSMVGASVNADQVINAGQYTESAQQLQQIFTNKNKNFSLKEVSVENQKQKIGNGAVSHGVVTSAQVPILTAAESHLRRTVSAVKPLSV